jgi:hypothetical protein
MKVIGAYPYVAIALSGRPMMVSKLFLGDLGNLWTMLYALPPRSSVTKMGEHPGLVM